jgi:glycerate kinase
MVAVRVLLAPDCFTGTLTAAQAAAAMADGWSAQSPHDTLTACPLSDGGPGFVDTLASTLDGLLEAVTVTGPLGTLVPAQVLRVGETAYLETAQACGLHLVPPDRRDPGTTTTAGVGELLLAAVQGGATRVVLGLGGSATNDGGAGMLAALGAGDPALLGGGGEGLASLPPGALDGLRAVRDGLRGVRLVVATDVDVPLLGLQGASAGFARQKGATPEQAQRLEAALGHYADLAVRALGDAARPDLLAGSPDDAAARHRGRQRLTAAPGAGAAGGLGFGLLLLGGHRVPGSAAVLDAVGFDDLLTRTDLVVTGEGTFDWQSLRGKVVSAVAERALTVGVPTVVVAGQVEAGRRETTAAGIEAAYAVADGGAEVAAALADPAGTLAARVRRVARTWSPRPR